MVTSNYSRYHVDRYQKFQNIEFYFVGPIKITVFLIVIRYMSTFLELFFTFLILAENPKKST